ncbi:hypothetical protein LSH36_28g08000 [Paralvinella palmiformis]|uniref:Uncharacterized protein n=1 Tax=Paralvinella palmiformis TaxID=53620 RepID=A0AAD9KA65_9ANNE|nr:hypothetical protein LSH36_28g08000 [Paralvinella palmiformis]
MNYVGSISILDRGDAPAQAVIDRNARSLAQRVADETKEELAKVLTRVDNIYGNFELSQSLLESNKTNLECVQDLYQQQVTIFIVGYENVCGQKLRLLQQVNEFFVENATLLEEDDMLLQSPDLDLEEMEDAVEETLKQTENLAQKLSNLKKGLDEHMHNLAQIKGSTKAKKTKELEKDLNGAKKQLEQVNNSLRELAKGNYVIRNLNIGI